MYTMHTLHCRWEPFYGPFRSQRCLNERVCIHVDGQRAAPGTLLIAEATFVSPESNGYHGAPGVWGSEQVEGWKPVVRAVKDKGGVFFCQLVHCGRASHPGAWAWAVTCHTSALPILPHAAQPTHAHTPSTGCAHTTYWM